jgi:hypothetical protein
MIIHLRTPILIGPLVKSWPRVIKKTKIARNMPRKLRIISLEVRIKIAPG